MLILVPWKPVVFGWSLLTVMILMGYAAYCLQEVTALPTANSAGSTINPR